MAKTATTRGRATGSRSGASGTARNTASAMPRELRTGIKDLTKQFSDGVQQLCERTLGASQDTGAGRTARTTGTGTGRGRRTAA